MESPEAPTAHPPGTPGKLDVLARRARRRLPLFHAADATLDGRLGLVLESSPQGNAAVVGLVEESADGPRTVLRFPRRTVPTDARHSHRRAA